MLAIQHACVRSGCCVRHVNVHDSTLVGCICGTTQSLHTLTHSGPGPPATVRFQPGSADVRQASHTIEQLDLDLQDLIFRTHSEDKKACDRLAVFGQRLRSRRTSVSCLRICRRGQLGLSEPLRSSRLTTSGFATLAPARRPGSSDLQRFHKFMAKSGNHAQGTLNMKFTKQAVQESDATLQKYAASCLRDLRRRFTNADLAQAAATSFSIAFDAETTPERMRAWERVSSHFGIDREEFRRSCLALHRVKQTEMSSLQKR